MDKHTINQVLVLIISSTILYFSGFHLMSIGDLSSLLDGLIVMIFFFAFFPSISILTMLSAKIFKGFLSLKNQ